VLVCEWPVAVALKYFKIMLYKTLMSALSPMEAVNIFVRALMVAIHVHVILDMHWRRTNMIVKVCTCILCDMYIVASLHACF